MEWRYGRKVLWTGLGLLLGAVVGIGGFFTQAKGDNPTKRFITINMINLALATDVGQSTIQNFILSCISYFTYAQLFLLISLRALYSFAVDKVTGRKAKWYKTQRFG